VMTLFIFFHINFYCLDCISLYLTTGFEMRNAMFRFLSIILQTGFVRVRLCFDVSGCQFFSRLKKPLDLLGDFLFPLGTRIPTTDKRQLPCMFGDLESGTLIRKVNFWGIKVKVTYFSPA
jgi:hypothetical protein